MATSHQNLLTMFYSAQDLSLHYVNINIYIYIKCIYIYMCDVLCDVYVNVYIYIYMCVCTFETLSKPCLYPRCCRGERAA